MNIGENILKMRKEKGITQEQLADVLCISAGAISKWETETSIPDIAMLPKIANFFGVSIDRLFDFTLKESDAPENIIKRVREITIGFNHDEEIVKYDNIKAVFKCDEAISILTDACIKYPNNFELKAELCNYKQLDASKYKDPEVCKKVKREILAELYSIAKLAMNNDIIDRCYQMISGIHLELDEYDKAIETAKKYGCQNYLQTVYNQVTITSLIKQGKDEEAEKHVHNTIYASIVQIYVSIMSSLSLIKDVEKLKETNLTLINLLKTFSDDSPGPFDFCLAATYEVLAFLHYSSGEYDDSVKCFEELYNYAERSRIFSETKEITSDLLKKADKHRFLYNMPFDYKKHLFAAFDAFEAADDKNYMALKNREDFRKFIEKLKE